MKLPDELPDNVALFLSRILSVGFLALIALWIGKGQIAFVLLSLVFMYLGRRAGWTLSKNFLYDLPTVVVIVLCCVWGIAVAFGIHALIAWQQPHWILKAIFGFALGGYVAVPNYGLVAESTIPPEAIKKHDMLTMLPLWVYILSSVFFAFLL